MTIKPLNTLDTCIDMFREEIQNERAQGRINYSQIVTLLLEQSSLVQLSCYNTFRDHTHKLREQITKLMKQLHDSYNDETVKHMHKAAGAMKIISGVFNGTSSGIGGFLPESDAANPLQGAYATAKTFKDLFALGGQGIGGVDGGIDSFNRINETEQRGVQDQLNSLREEGKKLDQETSQNAEAAERKRIKDEDAIKELENAQSAAFRAVAG